MLPSQGGEEINFTEVHKRLSGSELILWSYNDFVEVLNNPIGSRATIEMKLEL